MTLPTGARLGRYQIADCIGAGGMGVVYRAYDPALERDVALKVLGPGLLEEARIVAALDHPHICAVYDVGVVDDTPFMAMQLIKGQSLRALLSSGPLPPDKVRRIGRQLAEGLEHAHGHGVIHRDFKTPNVMIAADGAAKIVDFGISVRLAEPTDQTLTADAVGADVKLSGTVPYMAPEVLRGQRPDARSDIWALGVVLYEMAAGRVPFHATTAPATIAAILNDRWPPLPPGTPAGLVRVIERCLAKDPPDRPARAGEVALALDVIDSQPSAATLVAPSRRPRAHMWSRRAVGAVAVLAIGALVYMAWARRATPPSPIRFGNPVQITTAVGVEEFPAWSSDGRMLAYVGRARGSIDNSPDSNSDIWVAQPGSGTPINRTGDHEGRDLFPAWSHDGSQISFWSDRDGPGCYVMNALSGAPRRIAAANAINPNPPQWSPDGRSIGCVTGERKASLDVISVETGQIQERIELPGEIPRFVTRSQDGRLIAYVSGPGGLNADLTRLNVLVVASATVRTITDGQTLVTSPNWSADGRTLYYVAHAGATMDLWEQRMNADGSAAGAPDTVTAGVGIKNATLSPDGRRLAYSQGRKLGNVWRLPFRPDRPATWSDAEQITFDQAYIECVSLSRDGTMLAINSDRAGSIDLWTLPSSGGEMTQITSDLSAEWCPDWSPDGSMLAFYAHRTGNREIWTVPAKGGEWRQLTDHPGPDLHPSWSSDGQLIVHLTGGRNGGGGGWISRFDGGPGWMVVSPNVIALRWSPTDARLAYISADRIWLLDTKATIAATSLTTTFSGALRWTPDGTAILHRMRGDTINAIDAAGKGPSRLLADLSGRPGQLGFYGTPTDGRSIYFVWHEDLGDVWVMDAVPPNQ